MPELYIGLGSNLGDPGGQMREAVRRLARELSVVDVSSAYLTEPVGLREQPLFLNAVLRAATDHTPHEVLGLLRTTEDDLGRQRDVPLGPRTIDLDLLLYGDLVLDDAELTVPHPRMAKRRFVLEPLAEIAPSLQLHEGGPTVTELLAALPAGESVERTTLADWPPGP